MRPWIALAPIALLLALGASAASAASAQGFAAYISPPRFEV
jgi:hypothetical protein